MDDIKKAKPIRQVEELPEKAVLNEVIFNKSDGCFYLGVETKKKEVKHGRNLEKARV